eukprot:gene5606-biopygen5622
MCLKCSGTEVVAAFVEVGHGVVEKLARTELELKERLGPSAKLLPADVGPRRAVKDGASQPWQASSKAQLAAAEGSMRDLPHRIEWGKQEILSEMVKILIPGRELDWRRLSSVWDPWAGTGVISKVMKEEWEHLNVMNNDWNPQLGWSEARNALQPGNYRAWREKYGMCDAIVTSPWFAGSADDM